METKFPHKINSMKCYDLAIVSGSIGGTSLAAHTPMRLLEEEHFRDITAWGGQQLSTIR